MKPPAKPMGQIRRPRMEVARLETLLAYHRGALEEIRKEALGMHGGWRARVLKVCRTMLGE